jgi:hypothetical protein
MALATVTASTSFAQEQSQNGGWQDAAAYVTRARRVSSGNGIDNR